MSSMSLLIPGFAGDDRGTNTFTLADVYSSGGSLNVYLDKRGRLRVIPGWVAYANQILDNGGAATYILGITSFRPSTLAAGAISYTVFALEGGLWELWTSTDGGQANRTRVFSGAIGATVGRIPSFAVFGDDIYIVNGNITPQKINSSLAITALTTTQLTAPTMTSGGIGAVNGNVKYKILPMIGKERKIASVTSANFQAAGNKVNVAWTADADVTVTGYEVWRTSGTGIDFYFVAYVDGRTTVAYLDNMADTVLITRPVLALVGSHGDPPPATYFVVAHKQRLWWMRTDANPTTIYPSDPGDPDSVYVERGIRLSDAKSQGDIIVGGHGDVDGALIVWMRGSIWKVSGTGQLVNGIFDWRARRTNASVGAVHSRAAIEVPKGAKFRDPNGDLQEVQGTCYAYLSTLGDWRVFDGDSDTIISHAIQGTFSEPAAAVNPQYAHKSYAFHDVDRGMLVWGYPRSASTVVDYFVGWNYLYGTWHLVDAANFGHVHPIEMPNQGSPRLTGGNNSAVTGGVLYSVFRATSQRLGASFSATWMSKPLFPPVEPGGPPDMRHLKRFQAAVFMFNRDWSSVGSLGIHAHDSADGGSAVFTRSTLPSTTRARVPLRYPAGNAREGKYYHAEGLRLKLTITGSIGDVYAADAIELQYTPKPGQTE